ncbi:MAG: hypothetical protein QM744_02835 [Mesorhizobium sp.]
MSSVASSTTDLKAFLKAVFPAYKGDLIFDDNGAEKDAAKIFTLKQMLAINDWLAQAKGPIYVGPPPENRFDASVFCLEYPAGYAAIDFFPPSFTLKHANGARVVGYILACGKEEFAKLIEKVQGTELARLLSSETPLPLAGWYLCSPFPFPRYGNTEIESALPAFEVLKSTQSAESTGEYEEESTAKINDALVFGNISDELANLPMVISVAENSFAKEWYTADPAPFIEVFKGVLSKHLVGKKEGRSFVTGALGKSRKRTKSNVISNFAFGLDIDDGSSFEKTFKQIRALNISALMYTTYNSGTTKIEIAHDRFWKWANANGRDPEQPTTEAVREYLKSEGKYVASVIDSATFETKEHSDGLKLIVRTRPIEKFRIVVPLARPYVYAQQLGEQRKVIERFSAKALGLGRMFGVEIDRAARDPSRLFYLPRHKKGNDNWAIKLSAGRILDFDEITEAYDKGKQSDDPFSQVGNDLGGRETVRSPGGVDLTEWEGKRALSFDIANIWRQHATDHIRRGADDYTSIKLSVACPYDDEHSEPGNPDDMGTFVQSADDEGFVFHCSHNACRGRNRLHMLSKAFEVFEIPETVLHDAEYDLRPDDEREEDEAENKVQDAAKAGETAPPRSGGLARIRKGLPFEQRREELRKAVVAANSTDPTVFQTKGMVRRVDAYGELEFVDKLKFKAVCNKAATYVEKPKNLNDGDPVLQPDIDFLMGCGERLFPELAGVRNTPVHSAKGTLRTTSGYDPDTEFLYQLDGIEIPEVSLNPSQDECSEAVRISLMKS